MDERVVQLVKGLLPDAEVLKIYKDGSGEIKIDVKLGGDVMACTLKKNHAGELYIE